MLSQTLNAPGPICGAPANKPRLSECSRLAAWLAPDLALTFALVTLLAVFCLFHGSTALFSDTDTGWHIRNGERIILTGALPHADPYSFSKPDQPWVAWEWGADVLMGAVDRVFGLRGIALLYGVAIAAAVWVWFRLNRAVGGNFLITCLLFVPMVSTMALHWLARPHLFSWLFLLGLVWLCEKMPYRLTWKHLLSVALGVALWANLHASFFFAPLIALIYALGARLKPWLWEPPGSPARDWPPEIRETPAGEYLWLALAALLGSLVNPNGWRLHQHVFEYLSDSALLDQITEFQSFNFHQAGSSQILLTLAICLAGAFASLAIQRPGRFLLSMLLSAMALRSVRALPLAALLLLPLANGSITAVLADARSLAPSLRRLLGDALAYGDRLHVLDARFRGFATAALLIVLIGALTPATPDSLPPIRLLRHAP